MYTCIYRYTYRAHRCDERIVGAEDRFAVGVEAKKLTAARRCAGPVRHRPFHFGTARPIYFGAARWTYFRTGGPTDFGTVGPSYSGTARPVYFWPGGRFRFWKARRVRLEE